MNALDDSILLKQSDMFLDATQTRREQVNEALTRTYHVLRICLLGRSMCICLTFYVENQDHDTYVRLLARGDQFLCRTSTNLRLDNAADYR